MLLTTLRDFEWLNEAGEVSFGERGVKMTAAPETDFWMNGAGGYCKHNGHFFFCRQNGAFTMTVCWRPGEAADFAQCGLMVRADEKHWCKISLMSKTGGSCHIASVVTGEAGSDMALVPAEAVPPEIWFRVKSYDNGALELFYSFNGAVFTAVRRFYLPPAPTGAEAGVFICCPASRPYTAVLSSIEFA